MPTESNGLLHIALFYNGDVEYLDSVVPFLIEGLDNGESVMAVVPGSKFELLRGALGVAAERISLADMAAVGGNPARTFPLLMLASERNPGRMRLVAEPVYPSRYEDAYPACVQNEALFNTAFAARPLTTLCPYDVGLGEDVLTDARTTHPKIWQGGAVADSNLFSFPEGLARSNIALPIEPGAHTRTVRKLTDLSDARAFVARYAESEGLSAERVGDLQLIATELATNSLEHAGGACTLAMWRQHGHLICQVNDGGHLGDPLAGRRVPDGHATGGRGLFLVNALADLVRTHSSEGGTAIRTYFSLAPG